MRNRGEIDTSVFLDFIRLVVAGTSTTCPGAWRRVRLLRPRRPTLALHVGTPQPFSSPTSRTTSMRATPRSTWLLRHFGVRLRSSWSRTEPIAEREIDEARSRFTTLLTRTDGIRRHRLRRSGTSCRLAPIKTLWMAESDAVTQSRANAFVGGCTSAIGWWGGSETAKQDGVDAIAPCRSTHRARGSGSPQAREQQAGIIRLLLERGAR